MSARKQCARHHLAAVPTGYLGIAFASPGALRTFPRGDRHEKDEAGDDRQRHGGRAHARGAVEDRPRPLRHHGVRCRAPSQLQPHPAVAGARRRTDARRNRAQPAELVRREQHHAPPRQEGGRRRPQEAHRARRGRHRGDLRPAADRHRFEPLRPARSRQGPRRRHRLPRHRRHQRDDRGGHQVQARGRHRRRPARAGGCQRPDAARHAGQRGARGALADGAPARRRGGQAAAEVARGARP